VLNFSRMVGLWFFFFLLVENPSERGAVADHCFRAWIAPYSGQPLR
jgi:hypothetical protein